MEEESPTQVIHLSGRTVFGVPVGDLFCRFNTCTLVSGRFEVGAAGPALLRCTPGGPSQSRMYVVNICIGLDFRCWPALPSETVTPFHPFHLHERRIESYCQFPAQQAL